MLKKSITALAVAAALAQTGGALAANHDYHNMHGQPKTKQDWWPKQLNLRPLRNNVDVADPMGEDFDYKAAFEQLDLAAVKADINELLTTSQDWWPADYGNYGPFFIRMAWHGAGTYRVSDGRGGAGGGQQRFEPLNSWPDNGNLDKARRLLWSIKAKYGRSISWADLMVLTGNAALENMGFNTFGFAGGREDDWEPELVYWGPEAEMLGDQRYEEGRKLQQPLAAVQMGLIYVNPEGPNGVPDPLLAAKDIRETFGRMAMNDEETVALIAGGHTFGKAHGAHKPDDCVGREPAAESVDKQGFGWMNKCGKGNAEDTVTSGLEGAWTAAPTQWSMMYLSNLFAYDWEMTKSPAGAVQWKPKGNAAANTVPDAHVEGVRHAPMMFTTDLALKEDPAYREISQRFLNNPEEFELAFAKAWFKLTHRDMGPRARYLGSEVPSEELLWQDPLPEADYQTIGAAEVEKLEAMIRDADIEISAAVRTAWASAGSYRASDMRGGANGARVRLAPQNGWAVNNPDELEDVLEELEEIQEDFNKAQRGNTRVSLADVIVLAGNVAIEDAAKAAGHDIDVPFAPGRVDATQAMTDVESFGNLEPKADGFRNYYTADAMMTPSQALVDRADLLDLTVQEMTALVGGMRVLGANYDGSEHGVFTDQPGALSNDFFVNLLDMRNTWKPIEEGSFEFVGHDRVTGEMKWKATEVDLVFGSNSELRAVAEVYAFDNGEQKFVEDFVNAWNKVMNADRFDLR
ncbi:MAG: catalase/peroxidase HPI [Halieaceae bacterium]|jgi:catalase-peroxidase|nr:catalase/peroxidase HPI [Halieaceae bacterium]